MPLMTWNEKMSVGVAALDAEHKELVALVNELHDGIQAGRANDALIHVLDGLIAYTKSHFRHEEELFAQAAYPASSEHKKEHEDLTRQVIEIQAKVKAGVMGTLSLEVMNFLKSWLMNHIQGSDKRYAPHLNAQGIT
jgi:hemerythrin